MAEHLLLLDKVARSVARRRRLQQDDIHDFAQSVQLRVIERDYEVFRQFAGHSSLETYLYVVVGRMLLDWLNSRYGKWRPCAKARAMGPAAMTLDRLISRDGYSLEEAVTALARADGPSERDLYELASHLPRRARRRFIAHEDAEGASSVPFADPIEWRQQEQRASHTSRALRHAVRRLPAEERRLLAMRYMQRHSVQEIAGRAGLDPKALYRRFDRVLRNLRRSLASEGITA